MKNWKIVLFLIAALIAVMILFSCKKEEIKQNSIVSYEQNDVRLRIVVINEDLSDGNLQGRLNGQFKLTTLPFSNEVSLNFNNGPKTVDCMVIVDTTMQYNSPVNFSKLAVIDMHSINPLGNVTTDTLLYEVYYNNNLIFQEILTNCQQSITLE